MAPACKRAERRTSLRRNRRSSKQRDHILTSYRPMDQDWKSCIKSVFMLHNDTVCIWIMIFAYVFFIVELFRSISNSDLAKKPKGVVLLIHLFSVRLTVIFNLLYLIFYVSSKKVGDILNTLCIWAHSIRIICYAAAISTYIFPTPLKSKGVINIHLVLWNFISLGLLIAGCTKRFGKLAAQSRVQMVFIAAMILSVIVFSMNLYYKTRLQKSVSFLFVSFLGIQLAGNLLLKLRWPESFSPGRFDIIGSSRQWFYLLTVIAAILSHYCFLEAFGDKPPSNSFMDGIANFFIKRAYSESTFAIVKCCADVIGAIYASFFINTFSMFFIHIYCSLQDQVSAD